MIKITPSHKTFNKDKKINFLLQVQSSENLKIKRPNLNLSIVIDVSSSMSGDFLNFAKSAAFNLIENLTENDRVSIVTYGSNVEIISESIEINNDLKIILKEKIKSLIANGNTALHQGWLLGAKTISPYVSKYDISRVLILSDGQANVGITDPNQFKSEASELSASGISTSSYGIGNYFNEVIMTNIAQGGNAFYSQSANDILNYFKQELTLIEKIVLKDIKLNVVCKNNSNNLNYKVLNDYFKLDNDIYLPNVLKGGESWMMLEVDAENQDQIELIVEATANDLNGKKYNFTSSAKVSKSSKQSLNKNKVMIERLKELEAVNLQIEAANEAKKGNWRRVEDISKQMKINADGNAYLLNVANNLSNLSACADANLFSKEAIYASRTMSTRAVSLNEDITQLNDDFGLKKGSQGKAV